MVLIHMRGCCTAMVVLETSLLIDAACMWKKQPREERDGRWKPLQQKEPPWCGQPTVQQQNV